MMRQKKTLWIISELFPPEETSTGYIMGEIANAMVEKYNVKVICGPEQYDKNKTIVKGNGVQINATITVDRVKEVAEDKGNKLSRIKKFILMSWRLYRLSRQKIKRGDEVLMVTNPFPLIILMGHLRRHLEFNLTLLVHDIAPEGLYTDIHIPSIIYPMVERVFNRAYASTDQLLSIGRDMSEVLAHKCCKYTHKPKIRVIENWSDTMGIFPVLRKDHKKVVIQYAGNIGNAQGIGDFIDVLHLSGCSNVEFSIWGTGSNEASIQAKVSNLGMNDCVIFNGPYKRSEQNEVLNKCDMALVRLVEGMYGLGVPSKTYNILAAGKPILYIGEQGTEVWRMIEDNGNGFCFAPSDRDGLCKFLCSLNHEDIPKLQAMGELSRDLAENYYSKEKILNKFIEYI